MTVPMRLVSLLSVLVMLSNPVLAQSLYLTESERDLSEDGPRAMQLEDVSLTYIPEPEARQFKKHDLITIVIDEVSSQESSQTLETESESSSNASITTLVDALQLLELRLRDQAATDLDLIDFDASREYTGEGEYGREDRFSARIAATVLEVKPNGTLVLEAVKRIEKDDEYQVMVLAGLARGEDITAQNTVMSSQLANLTLSVQNEGEVSDAAKKGIVTKFFDTLFAF